MGQLTVYEAISEMRTRSARGQEVSFSFMSYSESKQETEGIVEVRRARLRRRSRDADFLNGELLEPYTDLDTLEQRRFYIPTLMTFNGQKTTLL
ncbi:hypothetical protein [Cyclobacterium sp.]|uniref:hypothetical protein n=1 Tax=Cyclobacterium sp. TaxID=1966343 RepID=UPI0019B732B7|nr:hypothetical protein [Cyclobacterium sp.]MBD3630513.1 hypothetical protein [Cyclobacterium sp.]